MILHALAPGWDEPLVCVLLGGLIALLLFRFWTMVLTSAAGSLLLSYAGLCLVDRLGKIEAIAVRPETGNGPEFLLSSD